MLTINHAIDSFIVTLDLKWKLINPAFNRPISKPVLLSRTQSTDAGTLDWTQKNVYPWFLPVQTRWMDNDQYGHVNNAVYHSIFDSVINGYLMRSDRRKSYCSNCVSNKETLVLTPHQSGIVFGQSLWLATWPPTPAPSTEAPPTPTSTWPGSQSRRSGGHQVRITHETLEY